MQLRANTVSNKILHNPITSLFSESLNCVRNIGQVIADSGLSNSRIQSTAGVLDKGLQVLIDSANRESDGVISIIAIDNCTAVDPDDIAVS